MAATFQWPSTLPPPLHKAPPSKEEVEGQRCVRAGRPDEVMRADLGRASRHLACLRRAQEVRECAPLNISSSVFDSFEFSSLALLEKRRRAQEGRCTHERACLLLMPLRVLSAGRHFRIAASQPARQAKVSRLLDWRPIARLRPRCSLTTLRAQPSCHISQVRENSSREVGTRRELLTQIIIITAIISAPSAAQRHKCVTA